MQLRYEISRIGYGSYVHDNRTVQRSDAARHHLRAMVYDMLRADGLLDRMVAHRLTLSADLLDICPVAPGSYRTQTIRIREHGEPRVILTTYRLDADAA